MTRHARLPVLLAIAALLAAAPCFAAPEDDCIAVLTSDKGPQEKDSACQRLKRIGTAKSVPALAALLPDAQLSRAAREALEPMACPEAGAALCEAIGETSGLTKAGILDSIGERRDRKAIAAVKDLVLDADPVVAASAALALGKMGGPEAAAAMTSAKGKVAPAARAAWVDGLLMCADSLLAGGDAKAAAAIYADVLNSEQAEPARTAAYRGMVLASGDDAVGLVEKALLGNDRPSLLAALQLVRDIKGEAATRAFATAIAKVSPPVQVALIEALAQRGDGGAIPAILAAGSSDNPAVRSAAWRAMGLIGDASAVPALVKAAATAQEAEQAAARQALARLAGAEVRAALQAQLAGNDEALRMEVVRILGQRNEAAGTPVLLKAAQDQSERVSLAAIQALGKSDDGAAVPDLVKLLAATKSDAHRAELDTALVFICARGPGKEKLAESIVPALAGAEPPVKRILLHACGQLTGPAALGAMRAELKSTDAETRNAAIRALASTPDAGALPDLLVIAKESPDLAHRVLAIQACVRLTATPAMPADAKASALKSALDAAPRAQEKKLVLGALGKVPSPEALKAIEPYLADPAVKAEAAVAQRQVLELIRKALTKKIPPG